MLYSQLVTLFLIKLASALPQKQLTFLDRISQLQTDFSQFEAQFSQLEAHVESLPQTRLLRFPDGSIKVSTEGEKALHIIQDGGRKFVDVTEDILAEGGPLTVAINDGFDPYAHYPSALSYNHDSLSFDTIPSVEDMAAFLNKFSSFRTRYYRSDTGGEASNWLFEQISNVISASKSDNPPVLSKFSHTWGSQTSLILTFPSSLNDSRAISKESKPKLILSAHLDSTNLFPFLPAPGADDDGSGTTTMFAAAKGLIEAGWHSPSDKEVEFHWYSGEEGGLLGSQAVARAYASQKEKVIGNLQMDMTAWIKRGTEPVIGIMTDPQYTDSKLTQFLEKVSKEYIDIPFAETKCGYGCSDHASWQGIGAPASCATEALFENTSPFIHSTNDRMDKSDEFSVEHMRAFSKLAMAFAIELGGMKKDSA